jgi:outer membrane protein OmpA-like peptidoglycan-associated protein/uncharacterized protein YidB (DUF937 family)
MFMFDVLLKELAKRLNLGDRAPALLGLLLSLIFDEKRGGFAGFLDRFREKGLGASVTTWLGNGENKVLSVAQLESVLGQNVISQMASRLDLAPTAVANSLGHLLPTVLDKLSPDGKLPLAGTVPDVAKPYLAGYADFAQTAVLPDVVAAKAAVETLVHGPSKAGSGTSKAWLLLLPVLIAPLFFFVKSCSPNQSNEPISDPVAASAPSVISDGTTGTADASASNQPEPETMPDANAPAAEPAVLEPIAAPIKPELGAFKEIALPDSVTLNLPESGIESKLLAFITDSARAIDKTTWFDFDRILFDTSAATLRPESNEQIDNITKILVAYPNVTLKIGGYTDNTGALELNQKLSADRANAVMNALIARGIDAARLASEGYGPENPVADNATAEGREKNRRVSVRVTAK